MTSTCKEIKICCQKLVALFNTSGSEMKFVIATHTFATQRCMLPFLSRLFQ